LLSELYFDNQLGFKLILRVLENSHLSYSKLRKIFGYLEIDFRKGTSVVTELLRSVRSQNALAKECPFENWPEKHQDWLVGSSRAANGFYYNASKKKYEFLRSSYEFAYAKYLTLANKNWGVEERTYLLNSGAYYRPDFFVYDQNWTLEKIVEIKSMYNFEAALRLQKYYDFKRQYPEITTEVLLDKELYELIGTSYCKNLREWKSVRKHLGEIKE